MYKKYMRVSSKCFARVLKMRMNEVYIKWKVYSKAFNPWIPLTDLQACILANTMWMPTTVDVRKYNPLMPGNIRGLVIGLSGCGKTTAIFKLLLQLNCVFGKSLHREKL